VYAYDWSPRSNPLGTTKMGNQDHYAVLGVAKDADPEVIKAAYRALAKKYHPDCPGGSAERFCEISRAWEGLSKSEAPLFTSSITQLKTLCEEIRSAHDQTASDDRSAKPKSDYKTERRSVFAKLRRARGAPSVFGAATIVLIALLAQNLPAR
jgi:curved DNA-binding protein CbpA